jgi:hypothetical protein
LAPWFVTILIIINWGYLFFQIIHLFVDELEQYLGSSTFLHNPSCQLIVSLVHIKLSWVSIVPSVFLTHTN